MSAERRILAYHRAEGFVHRSIPDAVAAVLRLGREHGFGVETSDDPDRFTHGDLDGFDALVFVHTSGDVLPGPAHRRALEHHLGRGGGFFGVHAASSMGPVVDDWPWYRDLIGAAFKGHTGARLYSDDPVDESPGIVHAGTLSDAPDDAEWLGDALAMTSWEPATLHVEDPACPAIDGFRDGDTVDDEWYGFETNPRPHVHVLAAVDETTYEPHRGAMGDDHPVVWWHDVGGGRSVYNSMGHSATKWRDPRFLRSIVGGIALAARWRS